MVFEYLSKTSQLKSEMPASGRNGIFLVDNRLASRSITHQLKMNSTGLPDQLKSGIERVSGLSMDDVKVHYNSSKPAQLNAHAYAQGTEIHLATGQEKHLPHEAWHIVQQKQGRVKPTRQTKGIISINDEEGLEREADTMGRIANAVGNRSYSTTPYSNASVSANGLKFSPLQKVSISGDMLPVQRLARKHGLSDAQYGQRVKFAVLGYATLVIPGHPTQERTAVSDAQGHAEDHLIAWATGVIGAGAPPAGTTLEIFVSSSPCSSEFGTSSKEDGCHEEIKEFRTANGIIVRVHADKPYQPKGVGMKQSSVDAAGDMAAAGIHMDFSTRTGVAAALPAYVPAAGPVGAAADGGGVSLPVHGTVAQL